MKIVRIKISELKAPAKNVRIHTQKQIEEFIRSVKMFGQNGQSVWISLSPASARKFLGTTRDVPVKNLK